MIKRTINSYGRYFFVLAAGVFILHSGIRVNAGNQDQSFEEPKENTVSNVDFKNGSFEIPDIRAVDMPGARFPAADDLDWNWVPLAYMAGWLTRPVNQEDESDPYAFHIEIQREGFFDVDPVHGKQWAELNANVTGTLYQLCDTKPGQKVYYEFYHRARWEGEDIMHFFLRDPDDTAAEPVAECITGPDWKRYYGAYTIPDGQTVTEFAYVSVETSSGPAGGNYLDAIRFAAPAFLTIDKEVAAPAEISEGPYAVPGEKITYTTTITNVGEVETSNTVFTDILPDGITFLPDTVIVEYHDPDGNEVPSEELTQNISFDSATDTLTIEIGKTISGAELTDELTGVVIPNDYANGTGMIENGATVILSFEVLVTGENVPTGTWLENQAKVWYNDLGFELYNTNAAGEIEDDYNVSNIVGFKLFHHTEVTVTKELDAPAETAQTFVFRADGTPLDSTRPSNSFYLYITINQGKQDASVTAAELLPGTYTITELPANWHYQIAQTTPSIQTCRLDDQTTTWAFNYKNNHHPTNYIHGDDTAINLMQDE